uniref:Putative secreted protein n=1 Tax=Anopheles marajoara TaxID=58244 RepID=A0A2M4CEJ8_9DIPT
MAARSMISSCVASVSACSYSSPRSIAICSSAACSFAAGGGGIHFLPRTTPGTNGSSSGRSGVSSACLLM